MNCTSLLYFTLSLFTLGTYLTGADRIIPPFNTKENLEAFYFKHMQLNPEELDKQFDREFFTKNPLAFSTTFPHDQVINNGYHVYGSPISSWQDFMATWDHSKDVSLIEGIFIFANGSDPDLYKQVYMHSYKLDKVIVANDKFETQAKHFILKYINDKVYNDASKDSRDRYKYRIASEHVGKFIVHRSTALPDDFLKSIATLRPKAIEEFIKVYKSCYTLTAEQITRLKRVGFTIPEKV